MLKLFIPLAKNIFTGFSYDMKINLFTSNYQKTTPNFGAKTPRIKPVLLQEMPTDKLELSKNIGQILPERFEFGELELVAKDLLAKILRLELNAKTFKQDLRYYYTSQNREEYRELMKEKQKANSQFLRLAKKMGLNVHDLESYITEKKEYNFYAPKIHRAKTVEELENLKLRIEEKKVHDSIKELLYELIEYRKTLL